MGMVNQPWQAMFHITSKVDINIMGDIGSRRVSNNTINVLDVYNQDYIFAAVYVNNQFSDNLYPENYMFMFERNPGTMDSLDNVYDEHVTVREHDLQHGWVPSVDLDITSWNTYTTYNGVMNPWGNQPFWEANSSYIADICAISNVPIFDSAEHLTAFWNDGSTEGLLGISFKNGKFFDYIIDFDNPYEDEDAEDEGGPGTNDWDSDPINELSLPPNYFTDSGMVTIFTPTSAQLQALSNYLWSNSGLDLNQFKKIVDNPFDLILGLNWLPLHVVKGGTTGLNVGNILAQDTGLQMDYPTQENYIFDFGTISSGLMPESKSFVAYAPYSRMSILIPFIGKQAIDVDLVRQNLPINLKMKYNIVTGTICAYLYGKNSTLLYQWVGSVPATIPTAQNDHTNAIAGMMSIVSNAVQGAVTGGIAGGGLAGATVGGLVGAVQGASSADLKPTVTTSGSISGNGASINATGEAYIEVVQSKLSIANNHKHYLGYPRNTGGTIKDSYGFNSVKGIRVDSLRATDSERDEIKQILESGYIWGEIKTRSNGTKYGVVTPSPAVISDESLQLMLYQNHSSNSRIDKSLTHLHTYSTLTLKEPTSIQTPTIKLSASDVNVKKGNYAFIPKFDRFYYVTDVRSLTGGLWEIDLKCDVLMSFKSEIINNKAVFNHSEWKWNLYLNDGSLQVDARPKIKLKKFPNALDVNGTYVLIIAGHN